jgi:glycosyltransferase involved in cell wall biosynthesis
LDILHSTDFIPPTWGARHFVITVHDLNFLYYPQYLTAEARHYYNDQIQGAVSRADAILADSYATQRDLVQLLNVAPARVSVAHLAADERFRPLSPDATQRVLRKYDLEVRVDIEQPYLLFIGTWEPRKNLPGLLEALALLHARGERRHLVIAGRPGWLYDEVFTRVQTLNLTPWVHFIEQIPEDDLCALYNGALLLTMPSFYEGFGLPALEAMQCGTPTVVSNRASLPEVVGDAGLLIDPDDPSSIADAFERLARDETLREHLRKAGLARAGQFTWAETARKTLGTYKRLLAT